MADSDDDYDNRRKTQRDKFRRERNDNYDRRDDRRRDSWDHNDSRRPTGRSRDSSWNSRSRDRNDSGYRDYDSRRRDRFSPQRNDMSPPHAKRMRRGYNRDDYPSYEAPYNGPAPHQSHWSGGGGPSPGEMGGAHHGYGNQNRDDFPTQPAMMTFKQFLTTQDDNIEEHAASKKYNEYKIEYKRQQISEFFLAHKEEEWIDFQQNQPMSSQDLFTARLLSC